MTKLNSWTVGAALTITFVAVYALCAAAFAVAPAATIDFFNAWFHGLNLAGLQVGTKPFTFGVFLYGTVGIAVVAFVCGMVFAVSYNLIATPKIAGERR